MIKKATPHFDFESKKAYKKPSMKVIKIQHSQMLCSSPGVRSVSNSDGLGWKTDGFADDEGDY
ncbi:MAG: hypothetical protein IJ559_00905 [Prevotella sp.]|nr:hypothetical protein [Prevotella sp.]